MIDRARVHGREFNGAITSRNTRTDCAGATRRVAGPHLHLVVRYGSITVDPLSLLDLPTAVTRSP